MSIRADATTLLLKGLPIALCDGCSIRIEAVGLYSLISPQELIATCTAAGLAPVGTVSPAAPITGNIALQSAVGSRSSNVAFLSPLVGGDELAEDRRSALIQSAVEASGNAAAALIMNGGFICFSGAMRIANNFESGASIFALNCGPGPALNFETTEKLSGKAHKALRRDGRMVPAGPDSWRAAGIVSFCWLAPGEQLEGVTPDIGLGGALAISCSNGFKNRLLRCQSYEITSIV